MNIKILYIYFTVDAYVRAIEGQLATLSCSTNYIIQFDKVTFGDGYRSQTCSDPNAATILSPYCEKNNTCSVIVDRKLFPGSTCLESITELFQARWFCRYGI